MSTTAQILSHLDQGYKQADWFFASSARRRLLTYSISRWVDTPWKHYAMEAGEGADCLCLAVGVWQDCGLPIEKPPFYPVRWMFDAHHANTLYKEFKAHPWMVQVEQTDVVMTGDILLFHTHIARTHIGLYLPGNKIFHTTIGSKARIAEIRSQQGIKLAGISFRIRDPQNTKNSCGHPARSMRQHTINNVATI